MKKQRTQLYIQLLTLFIGFIFLCVVYLALTDIWHGEEPDLKGEWDIVQIGIKIIGGSILISIVISVVNLFRKKQG